MIGLDRHTVFLGPTGSGKTARMLREYSSDAVDVAIWLDCKLDAKDGVSEQSDHSVDGWAPLLDAVRDGASRIHVRSEQRGRKGWRGECDQIAATAWEIADSGYSVRLYVDEGESVQRKNGADDTGMAEALERLVFMGPSRLLTLAIGAKRHQRVSNDILDNADTIALAGIAEQQIQWLCSHYGPHADVLRRLPPYHSCMLSDRVEIADGQMSAHARIYRPVAFVGTHRLSQLVRI